MLLCGKYQEKKENNFFIFDFIMKNAKESKMYKKITYFLKLFNFYIKIIY